MYLRASMSILLTFLLATAQGWQVLIIDEAEQHCQPKPNTRARLLLGSNRMCITLGGEMGNTECVHYLWQDGQYVEQRGGGCQGNFFPQSARYFDMGNTGAVCEFFGSSDCSDRKIRDYSGGGGDHKVCAAQAVFDGTDGVVPNSADMRIQSILCTPKE